jgi:hypothetical protein
VCGQKQGPSCFLVQDGSHSSRSFPCVRSTTARTYPSVERWFDLEILEKVCDRADSRDFGETFWV